MSRYSPMVIFGIICLAIVSYGLPISDENDAALYLEKYGYLEKSADNETLDQEEVSTAIKDFQKFAGLNETVELVNKTISKMKVPRCDVKDEIRHYESTRNKRYALRDT